MERTSEFADLCVELNAGHFAGLKLVREPSVLVKKAVATVCKPQLSNKFLQYLTIAISLPNNSSNKLSRLRGYYMIVVTAS